MPASTAITANPERIGPPQSPEQPRIPHTSSFAKRAAPEVLTPTHAPDLRLLPQEFHARGKITFHTKDMEV
jgi:hypothetical protein